MTRTLPGCLLALCLVVPSFAGEAEQTKPNDAAQVGRGLISHDAKTRAQAVARLRAAMHDGRANAAYLDELSKAAAHWADSTARLADVWIERAVEGDARERRVAVRLLHALGPDAVERLALELRHQRHRPDVETLDARQTADATPQQEAEPEPPIQDTRVRKLYHVKPLAEAGMHALQIRSFLQKKANASEVMPYGDRYMVLAEAEGHRALAKAIAEIGAKRQEVGAASQPTTPAPAGAADSPKAGTEPREEAQEDKEKSRGAKKESGPGDSLVRTEPGSSPARWRLQPWVLQVPREDAKGLFGKRARTQTGVLVRTGTLEQGRKWAEAAHKLPNADALGRWKPLSLANNQGGSISAGKLFQYNKGVERAKSGAYKVVSGSLHHGYVFRFRPKEVAQTLVVEIETTRESVAMPVPTRVVRPAKDAAPIKIQEPQWSRTQSHTSVSVGVPSAVLLVFQGLDEQQPDDDVILVLTIEDKGSPYAPTTAADQKK